MMTSALERTESETEREKEQDKIFIEMPIPRTLSEIGFLQAEKVKLLENRRAVVCIFKMF